VKCYNVVHLLQIGLLNYHYRLNWDDLVTPFLIVLQTEVSGVKTFCVVKALARHHVIDLHMGPNHSAVIVEPGHVYTFGHYADGQLGTGNLKQQGGPIPIKQLEDKTVFVGF